MLNYTCTYTLSGILEGDNPLQPYVDRRSGSCVTDAG